MVGGFQWQGGSTAGKGESVAVESDVSERSDERGDGVMLKEDEKETREELSRPLPFHELLRKGLGEDFELCLEEYVRLHPRALRAAMEIAEPEAPPRLIPSSTRILRTESCFDQPIESWVADLVARASFRTEDGHVKEGDFRLRYVMDLRPGSRRVIGPLIHTDREFPKDRITEGICPTDEWFLPILSPEGAEKSAESLLRRCYPEARYGVRALDGRILAERMGLKIRRVRFPEERQEQGWVCFAAGRAELRDEQGGVIFEEIEPFTILLNTARCRTRAAENETLVHECIHVWLHRAFFLAQQLLPREEWKEEETEDQEGKEEKEGKPEGEEKAGNEGNEGNEKREEKTEREEKAGPAVGVSVSGLERPVFPTALMERQAEQLIRRILMEKRQVEREIYRLLRRRKDDSCGRSPETMAALLYGLSRAFRVSAEQARERLKDLGFEEADGVGRFVDGRRVPDHGCEGPWLPGTTYTLSLREAARLYQEDAAFRDRLDSGRYAFAEGHFCLRDPAFLREEPGLLPRLTPLGRRSVDRCCLVFRRKPEETDGAGREPHFPESRAARYRENSDQFGRIEFCAVEGTYARELENRRFLEEAAHWRSLLAAIPEDADLRTAVDIVRDRMGLSWSELALRIGVDRKTLSRWLSREEISLAHMTAICVALQLRSDVAEKLIRVSECRRRRVPGADAYWAMIEMARDLDVRRCNEILRQEGLPPLHAGEEAC